MRIGDILTRTFLGFVLLPLRAVFEPVTRRAQARLGR